MTELTVPIVYKGPPVWTGLEEAARAVAAVLSAQRCADIAARTGLDAEAAILRGFETSGPGTAAAVWWERHVGADQPQAQLLSALTGLSLPETSTVLGGALHAHLAARAGSVVGVEVFATARDAAWWLRGTRFAVEAALADR